MALSAMVLASECEWRAIDFRMAKDDFTNACAKFDCQSHRGFLGNFQAGVGLNGISLGFHGVCVGFLCVSVVFVQGSMGLKKSIRSITEEPDKPPYESMSHLNLNVPCNRFVFLKADV